MPLVELLVLSRIKSLKPPLASLSFLESLEEVVSADLLCSPKVSPKKSEIACLLVSEIFVSLHNCNFSKCFEFSKLLEMATFHCQGRKIRSFANYLSDFEDRHIFLGNIKKT